MAGCHDADVGLTRFDPAHAGLIASWPADAAESLAWCSVESVGAADVASWSAVTDDEVEAWVLDVGGMPVAYGEVWFDEDDREAELAHVIVAPAHRSAGVGRRFVEALAARAGERYASIVMRVRPDNLAAQRCYAAAGFVRASSAEEAAWNVRQPIAYVWMQH